MQLFFFEVGWPLDRGGLLFPRVLPSLSWVITTKNLHGFRRRSQLNILFGSCSLFLVTEEATRYEAMERDWRYVVNYLQMSLARLTAEGSTCSLFVGHAEEI